LGWLQEVLMIELRNNKAFVRILNRANVPFAVLGTEELYWRSCKKSWK
jgi:hypothetical protein